MGGFFMLFRLLILRFLPLMLLTFLKERRQIQKIVIVMIGIYIIGFFTAVWDVLIQFGWLGILCVPLLMFPHYLCYVFAGWILIRCLWSSWSTRVWKRIVFVSMLSVLTGVFLESYWNPKILQFFITIFK